MRGRILIAVVAGSFMLTGVAMAQMIDDFEDGNVNEWTTVGSGGTSAIVNAAAAHDGNFGLALASPRQTGWLWRGDAQAQVTQGDCFGCWTALNASSWTRNYFGFGATPNGCYSLVLGDNTNTLILQLNVGFGYATLADVPWTFINNYWYYIEVEWGVGGMMTGSLYDSDGTTLLAQVMGTDNTYTEGGIALRTFGDSQDPGYWDTIAHCGGATPVENTTWGAIKAQF
jgi:hypothetical protein